MLCSGCMLGLRFNKKSYFPQLTTQGLILSKKVRGVLVLLFCVRLPSLELTEEST